MAIDACPRPAESLRIEVPAIAEQLVQIRRRVVAWLTPIGVPQAVVADIVLAVNEACTNCIEHAYRSSGDGVIVVEAALKAGRIVVCVADHGTWRTPSSEPTTRGRGLPIIAAMSDGVELAKSSAGTTVRISFDAGADRPQGFGSRTT